VIKQQHLRRKAGATIERERDREREREMDAEQQKKGRLLKAK
jgi:hypothetical protein